MEKQENKPKENSDWKTLCFRCEHRAVFLEDSEKAKDSSIPTPRYECRLINNSISSCYMFSPVKPLTIEKTEQEDPRGITLGILGARVTPSLKQPELVLASKVLKNKVLVYWKPKTVKNEKD